MSDVTGLSRKRLLVTGATAALVAVGSEQVAKAAVEQASASDPANLFTGAVVSHDPPYLIVDVRGLGMTRVRVADNAYVVHDSSVAPGFRVFKSGEAVVVRGLFEDGVLTASEFQPMFRRMEGTIVADDGDVARTSIGPLRVPSEVRGRMRAVLVPGRRFDAQVWIDPDGQAPVAAQLNVYS